ncbi:MAG: hypothetical protein HZC22_13235 [Rhodocyclales bacterium]|nr:hypothetical protein [Rhodocyclales bacterium]
MGLHSDLPLYKTVYELLQLIMRLVKNMPREFKQALGGELRDQCLKITILILRANVATDKQPHLMEIIERTGVRARRTTTTDFPLTSGAA